jgi:AAA ATPase domain/AAA domain, putative AbiEii toxin, Type IV TA system
MNRDGLTSITIENFKGIGEAVTVPLRPITLLFGANSAGKSTVIQALQYAWEVLENRNPDVDRTRLGGEAIDLGGFRNLVHQHELSRRIRITIGIAAISTLLEPYSERRLSSDGLSRPSSLDDVSVATLLSSNVADFSVTDHYDVDHVGLVLECAQPEGWDSPVVTAYGTSINDIPMATVRLVENASPPRTAISFINWEHPVWQSLPGMDGDRLEELKNTWMATDAVYMGDAIPFVYEWKSVVPEFGRPYPVSGRLESPEELPELWWFWELLSQLIVRPGELALSVLREMRYLGPLREAPPRNGLPPKSRDLSRWSSGLGAWDALSRRESRTNIDIPGYKYEEEDPSLVEQVDRYVHDTLELGYSIRRNERVTVDVDDPIIAALRLLAIQYEERDAAYLRSQVLEPLLALPRVSVVQLHDEKNDVDVDPQDVGVGVAQVLPVVVGAVDPNCTVFVVEQPELHIHPAVQSKLGDVFLTEALGKDKRKGRIFLLETHSEHLILRILRRIRETSEGERPSEIPEITPEDVQVIYARTSAEEGTRFFIQEITQDGDFAADWPDGFFTEREEDLF